MTPEYDQVEGGEFDWFAVDADGCIGHFSSAGFGPVPVQLLQNLPACELALDAMQALPTIGSAVGHLSGDISDWLAMAARGCHSFDWQHWSGPYLRAATPGVSINCRDLPADLVDLLRLVEFRDVSFADLNEIRPEWLCQCEQAQRAVVVGRRDEGNEADKQGA